MPPGSDRAARLAAPRRSRGGGVFGRGRLLLLAASIASLPPPSSARPASREALSDGPTGLDRDFSAPTRVSLLRGRPDAPAAPADPPPLEEHLRRAVTSIGRGLEDLESISEALATGRVDDRAALEWGMTDAQLVALREEPAPFEELEARAREARDAARELASAVPALIGDARGLLGDSSQENTEHGGEVAAFGDDLERLLTEMFAGTGTGRRLKNLSSHDSGDPHPHRGGRSRPEGHSPMGGLHQNLGSHFKGLRSSARASIPRLSDVFKSGLSGLGGARRGQRPSRRVDAGRRLQQQDAPDDSCDADCRDKECQCAALVDCVREFRVNDYAVIYSRGIEVEDDPVGSPDIFDAAELLEKIKDIDALVEEFDEAGSFSGAEEEGGGFEPSPSGGEAGREGDASAGEFGEGAAGRRASLRSREDGGEEGIDREVGIESGNPPGRPASDICTDILGSFFVPCEDFETGCTTSDGRSHRMTVDEICDSVNSPDLVQFSNMTSLFDEASPSSIEEGCGDELDEDFMLARAEEGLSGFIDDQFDTLRFERGQAQGMNEQYYLISLNPRTFGETFVQACLEDQRDCCPYPGYTLGATIRQTVVYPSSTQTQAVDVSFECNETTLVGTVLQDTTWEYRGRTNPGGWGSFYDAVWTLPSDALRPVIPVAGLREALNDTLDAALDSLVASYENCISNGCAATARVGLRACQEMIDCAESVWDAGEGSGLPNQYPFFDGPDFSSVRGLDWIPSFDRDGVFPYFEDGVARIERVENFTRTVERLFDFTFSYTLRHVISLDPGIDTNLNEDFQDDCASNSNKCCPIEASTWKVTITQRIENLKRVSGLISHLSVTDGQGQTREADITFGCNLTDTLAAVMDETDWYYEIDNNGRDLFEYTLPGGELSGVVPHAPFFNYTGGKFTAIDFPRGWNVPPNEQGLIELVDPENDAFVFRDRNAVEIHEKPFETRFGYARMISFEQPASCSLDPRQDDRCDVARSTLFGSDASVGQICSVADSGKMPGSCCLDNVETDANFGDEYRCGMACQRPGPYFLGFSEQACDQVDGTWCRAPCTTLKACVENKPSKEHCASAARYEIGDGGLVITHKSRVCDVAEDVVNVTVACTDEDWMPCLLPVPRLTSAPSSTPTSRPSTEPSGVPSGSGLPSSLPSHLPSLDPTTGSSGNADDFESLGNFVGGGFAMEGSSMGASFGEDFLPGIDESANDNAVTNYCEIRNLTFTYTISFAEKADSNSAKVITKFNKGSEGSVKDLYDLLNSTELESGDSIVVSSQETVRLCSYADHSALVRVDVQDRDFNEAFDDFSKDLVISDPADEDQCRQVRRFLGYDEDYNIDDEICREYYSIKCDYDDPDYLEFVKTIKSEARGGKIPDFQGFKFEASQFEGSEFEGFEFREFQFKGFEPAPDLSFREIERRDFEPPEAAPDKTAMFAIRQSLIITEKTMKIMELNWQKLAAEKCYFTGTEFEFLCAAEAAISNTKNNILRAVYTVIFLLHTATEIAYVEVFENHAEEEKEILYTIRAMYTNLEDMSIVLYDNQATLNENMREQHTEVRDTLVSNHEEMTSILVDQHTKIGVRLTEQHTLIGEQLTEQANDIGEQLTVQHNAMGEQLTTQHTSMGEQLTEAHRILRDNIVALAHALGGDIGDVFDRRLQGTSPLGWPEGETPYELLKNISATVLAASRTIVTPNVTNENATFDFGPSIANQIDSVEDNLEGVIKSIGGSIKDEINTAREKLEDLVKNETVPAKEVINSIEAKMNSTQASLMDEIAATRTNLEAEINSMRDYLNGQISSMHDSFAAQLAITPPHSDRSDAGEPKLGALIASSFGLDITVSCMSPVNANTQPSAPVSLDFLVHSRAFGMGCNATVTQVLAIYASSDGAYQSQSGTINHSSFIAPGLQSVGVEWERQNGMIGSIEAIVMLHLTARRVDEKGSVYEKTETFDYRMCHSLRNTPGPISAPVTPMPTSLSTPGPTRDPTPSPVTTAPPPPSLYKVVCGKQTSPHCGNDPVMDAEASELHEVRCCSDTSKAGWLKRSQCNVWAASKIGLCHAEKTYAEAKAICEGAGARLCTEKELSDNCTLGSGCGHDNEYNWSSTPVPNAV